MPGGHEEQPRSKAHRAFHATAIDLSPLGASRDYRLLWFSAIVSEVGSEATAIALLVQVYAITGSAAAVGAVGAVEFVALFIGTTLGAPHIDRRDRRNLLLLTQVSMAASAAVLLATALMATPPIWLVFLAAGGVSLFSGLDAPTRAAMIPNLVPAGKLPAAIALTTTMYSVAWILGSMVGGVTIALGGVALAYGFDLASYLAAVVLVMMIKPMPPLGLETRPATSVWSDLRDGLAYLKGRRVLQSTFSIDLIAMVFGLPAALFPIIALEQHAGNPQVVGWFFAAIALGSLVASLTSGWMGGVRHQGKAVVIAVVAWGCAITVFGFTTHLLWLGLVLLALAGAADTISAVFRGTILQANVPDALRGRLSSVHFLVVAGGPRLGNLEAGLVASLTSTPFAIISGGVAVVVGAIANAALVPQFWRYHAGEET